jgi:uncharacterized membrane protein YhaH (DUF805 family)
MNFFEAINAGFRNYVNFATRAARSEYWYWVLFSVIGSIITSILDTGIFPYSEISPLNSIFVVVTMLPGIAIGVRRLHDIGRTGWWMLLAITIIGAFVLLYWACLKGEDGPNQYGPDPLTRMG